MLPPDFQRHCAAVTAWGPNVLTLTELLQTAVATLHTPGMLGAADKLLSWEPGKGAAVADSSNNNNVGCLQWVHMGSQQQANQGWETQYALRGLLSFSCPS
jgi:hypothetical protein